MNANVTFKTGVKSALITLSFSTMALLSACGGGGDSASQNAEVPNTAAPTNTTTTTGSTTATPKTFTKYNLSGAPYVAGGIDTVGCVKDNVTGLTWEVKTDEAANQTPTFRDKDFGYEWRSTSGGVVGTKAVASGAAATNVNGRCQSATGLINCDTQDYINAVNAAGVCGYQNWRLPTTSELLGLIDTSKTAAPYIYADLGSTSFDPETQGSSVRGYWASDVNSANAAQHAGVSFSLKTGNRAQWHSASYNYVRLVRSGN
ncbi:Protein of unknown function [Thiothrix caldifontis]|uniref:Lcl C-terminal domain-containing protein n=1 Tax=Thiothrix caldifontis TaxID=525918 RepID=A0A1H3XIZ6_9GAMM|nr:DUF1566 domain-containing protein [Thiothrix caldifontis]SDZ99283.1 Protein of unknown function [Thiothrix caldifontis]